MYQERYDWKFEDPITSITWFESTGDWAALYVNGELEWQGHPGDFETGRWLELLDLKANGDLITRDLMVDEDWLSAQNRARFGPLEEEVKVRV